MPLILEHIVKRFGGKAVFDGFSHTFPAAGLVAVTGPSGCGKTTLLRLIAGLERLDSGAIRLPKAARVSMVFQEDRLLPTLDAHGNILAVLGERGAASSRLADRCLAQVGLEGEERTYPAALSGGMRRRVAIARAVAYGGDILLLDEPFKGLDAALKQQVIEFTLEQRAHRLTLLVTHDPTEVSLADEVLRLG